MVDFLAKSEAELLSALLEGVRGLLASLPKCSYCGRPATRAFERGGHRYCDQHGTAEFLRGTQVAPEYPRAPWIRRLTELLVTEHCEPTRAYALNRAWLLVTGAARGIRGANVARVAKRAIEDLETIAAGAAVPGDPDRLLLPTKE